MLEIIKIIPESIAETAGIDVGDRILQVNGREINDPLDFRFYSADSGIEVLVNRNGSYILFDLEKESWENLGCEFREMRIRSCKNNCIFCFVHQNPEGLRKTLYLKDEDYRFSFLYGNYITLTNIKDKDLRRIIDQKLSPLYISVHATDSRCRKKLLGVDFDDRLISKLEYLVNGGIQLHAQIVVCPGINDGNVLIQTINDLKKYYPGVKSVAIVPVGLTRYRKGLTPLRLLQKRELHEIIAITTDLRKKHLKELDSGFIYLADEFFLQADLPVPGKPYYEDFYQMENGVGEMRYTIDQFNSDLKIVPKALSKPIKITWVTGTLAAESIDKFILAKLRKVEGLEINMIAVKNDFYGHSVSVSGLLVGQDIYRQLAGNDLGDMVILPPKVVNDDNLFIDGWSLNRLQKKLNVPCHVFKESFADLVKIIHEKYSPRIYTDK